MLGWGGLRTASKYFRKSSNPGPGLGQGLNAHPDLMAVDREGRDLTGGGEVSMGGGVNITCPCQPCDRLKGKVEELAIQRGHLKTLLACAVTLVTSL